MTRVAVWGTFDVDNFGDHLFPLVARRELEARIPGVVVDCYSPFGPRHPTRLDGPVPGHGLGHFHDDRRDEFADRYDAVLIGGGELLHLNDPLLRHFYDVDPAEIDQVQPSAWFLEALGSSREDRCPVVWHGLGVPFDFRPDQAERVRTALEHRTWATVRDPYSRERLLSAGVGAEVEVVPDSALLVDRLFTPTQLAERLADARRAGWYPITPALVLQGCDLLMPSVDAIAEALVPFVVDGGLTPVQLETGRCRGDAAFADALCERLSATSPTKPYRVPPTATVEEIVAVIAGADAVVGSSLHAAVTAVAFRRPFVLLNLGDESKLRGFVAQAGFESNLVEVIGELRTTLSAARARPPCDGHVASLRDAVDGHLDRVAGVVAASHARRLACRRGHTSSVMPAPPPDRSADAETIELPAEADEGPAVPRQGLRYAVRTFRHRDFTVFWLGALASNTGSWVQNLAVPFVLYQITKSAFWVGLSTFTQFVPVMLLGPLAGSVADRFDRRKVLIVTQSLMALGALGLWAAWAGGVRNPGAILVIVAISGIFAGINIPSWQSFVNDLVPRDDLLSAVTLNSLQFNAARALGPAIAGILLASLGPSWAFFLNGVSFLFVIGALLLVRNRQVARVTALSGGFLRQFRRAMAYTRGQPGILVGILVAVLVAGLGNPVFQFTVVFSAEVYHVGPIGLSLLNVSLGLGAVLAAPLVSGWDALFSRAALVRWGLLLYGSAIVAFALAPVYLLGLLALVIVGGGFLVVISATNTSVQVIVADHMRGRVMALRIMAFTGAYPLGALLQGTLSDIIGPRQTVGGAGVLLLLAGMWLALHPALLRRLDDEHDEVVGAGGD